MELLLFQKVILKPCIVYDLDQQPSKNYQKLIQETVNSSSTFLVQQLQKTKQTNKKNTSLGLHSLWFFCHCFVDGNNIHLMDFDDTRLNDMWLFQNKLKQNIWIIPIYHIRQTSEKIACKPGLDNL